MSPEAVLEEKCAKPIQFYCQKWRDRPFGAGETRASVTISTPCAQLRDGPYPGTLDEEYTITCEMPKDKVSAMIGKRGAHVKQVQGQTHTLIKFEEANETLADGQPETQTLVIKGKILDTCRAHALMMQRYHEVDQEQRPPAARGAPDKIIYIYVYFSDREAPGWSESTPDKHDLTAARDMP